MKKLLCLVLAALLLLSMAACGGETEKAPYETTYVSKFKSEGEFVTVNDPVSWEGINSVPVKQANMDITEARKICVDFLRYAKTALWVPDDFYPIWSDAVLHTDGSTPDRSMDGGVIYGGLPYISWATGSVYRLMDYIDEETAVVDMERAGRVPLAFGNQCANGAYVGFARVINSANYGVTETMVVKNGFNRLGDYTYSDVLTRYSVDYGTPHIIQENGEEVMYEAYAKLKAADGIVYWTTAGHVVLVASDAVVVRDANGKIDPGQSYITVLDQTPTWKTATGAKGDQYTYQANVDEKWNFMKLLSGNYLPFTFAEWEGTDPIEETEFSISHQGDTITMKDVFELKVTSNYYIMDLYLQVFDKWGNEVYKLASRPIKDAGVKEFRFYKAGDNMDSWGDVDSLKAGGDYTAKIYMQLGTGERPVLWEGKLIVE